MNNDDMYFADLDQKNPEYNEIRTKKLELLYEGGEELKRNASLFIKREIMEANDTSYQARLQNVYYQNYVAKIINSYNSDTFSKPFNVTPAADATDITTPGMDIEKTEEGFWKDFAENADLQGHSFEQVLSCLNKSSLITKRAYIGIDFPKLDTQPDTLLEEEILGANRAYIFDIPILSITDWNIDDYGNYRWIIIKDVQIPRKDWKSRRDKKIITFKVWQRDDETGLISYKTYQLIKKATATPNAKDICSLIEEDDVSFNQIPVICHCQPTELWLGGLIAGLAEEHLTRRSALIYSMNKSLFAIPIYTQGPEFVRNELSAIKENEYRGLDTVSQMKGKGAAVIAGGDKLEYLEPKGACYTIVDEQLKELVNSMHDVCNQMNLAGSLNKTAVDRSGLSKMMDNISKEIVLSTYGRNAARTAIKIYNLIAAARGEKNIIWTPKGLSDYKIVDVDQSLNQINTFQTLKQVVPSKTFLKATSKRLAIEISPNLSPTEAQSIENEINEFYDASSEDELFADPQDKQQDNMRLSADLTTKPNKKLQSKDK